MPFLPFQSEVLVTGLEKSEVLQRLDLVTRNVNFLDYEARQKKGFEFNGIVHQDGFRLSLVIDKADSFLPLIQGKVEESGKGSILFLEYKLFPGSVFFLGFWTIVTLVLFFFFGLMAEKPLYALVSLALGISNYLFAWSHFKRKTKSSQEIFHRLLQ
ncbi:fumarate hydratase [Indibacter alkaliphilus LW1]|jgi:hypothetical protein|uniref:Fumarate hydratase n=1 Tax=Indibacter alkaliphilus (strain CCUG 57479 / KCTC 22604 / LW1) TaxID=1189612 RepID=S2D4M6_INDAL|nr:hypothetical protein [Indibacter alkaliphilus]EOZ92000.1 fumarate hydratase [Indibacter alkaliphilus LW1]